MWPFRRARQLAEDRDKILRETAEQLQIAVQEKQAAEQEKQAAEQEKQAAEERRARLAAEEQAKLERLGRRQTEVRFKDGTLITLRGAGVVVTSEYGYVAARVKQVWDPKSNIFRITIPIDEVLCVISTHRGDDAVPETSLTFSKWKD
jgi:methylthioribose-1-phosphate isomerase